MIQKPHNTGFTLLEMLVVLGIFAIMTSITVFNYDKFRSQTILINMAYEVALSIRESQIYGVSVRSPDNSSTSEDFRYPYGVHFEKDSSTYYLFVDNYGNIDGKANCIQNECITPYILQRGIKVTDLKKGCSGSSLDSLSVSFRRPNPEAVFDGSLSVPFAEITLQSPDKDIQYVLVRNNGQIEVRRESICPQP